MSRRWESKQKSVVPFSRGISNLGQTCYMNAVFQCLAGVPDLVRLIVNVEDKENLLVAHLLKDILVKMEINQVFRDDVMKFCTQVSKKAKQFDGYTQEDAHEFLHWLINHVNDEITAQPPKPKRSVSLSSNSDGVGRLFKGKYAEEVRCPHCGVQKAGEIPFLTLTLKLPQPRQQLIKITLWDGQLNNGIQFGFRLEENATVIQAQEALKSYIHDTQGRTVGEFALFEKSESGYSIIPKSKIVGIADSADNNEVPNIYAVEIFEADDSLPVIFYFQYQHGDDTVRLTQPMLATANLSESSVDLRKPAIEKLCAIKGLDAFVFDHVIVALCCEQAAGQVTEMPEKVHRTQLLRMAEQNARKQQVNHRFMFYHLAAFLDPSDKMNELYRHLDEKQAQEPLVDFSVGQLKSEESFGNSLQDCIRHYLKSEVLETTCNKCQHNNLLRNVKVSRWPDTLLIHLRRFSGNTPKNKLEIPFPVDDLDLAEFGKAQNEPLIYQLGSIILHHGNTIGSGHYTAVVRNSIDRRWRSFDDHVVDEWPVGKIDQRLPTYMFVYTKHRPRSTADTTIIIREYPPESADSGPSHKPTELPSPKSSNEKRVVKVTHHLVTDSSVKNDAVATLSCSSGNASATSSSQMPLTMKQSQSNGEQSDSPNHARENYPSSKKSLQEENRTHSIKKPDQPVTIQKPNALENDQARKAANFTVNVDAASKEVERIAANGHPEQHLDAPREHPSVSTHDQSQGTKSNGEKSKKLREAEPSASSKQPSDVSVIKKGFVETLKSVFIGNAKSQIADAKMDEHKRAKLLFQSRNETDWFAIVDSSREHFEIFENKLGLADYAKITPALSSKYQLYIFLRFVKRSKTVDVLSEGFGSKERIVEIIHRVAKHVSQALKLPPADRITWKRAADTFQRWQYPRAVGALGEFLLPVGRNGHMFVIVLVDGNGHLIAFDVMLSVKKEPSQMYTNSKMRQQIAESKAHFPQDKNVPYAILGRCDCGLVDGIMRPFSVDSNKERNCFNMRFFAAWQIFLRFRIAFRKEFPANTSYTTFDFGTAKDIVEACLYFTAEKMKTYFPEKPVKYALNQLSSSNRTPSSIDEDVTNARKKLCSFFAGKDFSFLASDV